MGIFDKAKEALGDHADKVSSAIDKAGDAVDEKTGGKYAEHVDQGQQLAKDRLADLNRDRAAEPPA